MFKAEIIAVGSELLTPFRTDTNSLYLTGTLEEKGIQVIAKSIISDDLGQLVFAFKTAFARSDVIICSGGLGPTVDDLTREALCEFLGIKLEFHPEIYERIESRIRLWRRNLPIPEGNQKQAMVPEGAHILPNDHGTAPGIYLEKDGKQFFLLPGPPFELEHMWQKYGLNLLKEGASVQRKIFRVCMMAESHVDELLQPVSSTLRDLQYTILASPGEIEVHLTGPTSASDELINATAEIRIILGNRIFAESAEGMETVVGRLLKEKRKKVAVAESCTGGLLGKRLTDIAGSSQYFDRGVVTYSNESKTELLGVPPELIERYGAVSEAVASAMASGIRRVARVDYGISITGVAGPDGGSEEKPVGLVFVGLATENEITVQRYHFPVPRDRVRFFATQAALNMLRLTLLQSNDS